MPLQLDLQQIADITEGQLLGDNKLIQSVSIDSRTIKPGDLFVAIHGEKFDGHDFLPKVAEAGATAAMIDAEQQTSLPVVLVADTRRALAVLARAHRQRFDIPVFAITGSCGKTTARAMLASILSECGNVLASESSFNNDIGMPLTLLKLQSAHQFAVVEMGTNHFGEIANLTQIAHPNVAMILNVAATHLEFLKSEEGVARAKGEIFQGLPDDGIALIPVDSPYRAYWQSLLGQKRCVTFGLTAEADVWADEIVQDAEGHSLFQLKTQANSIEVCLPLLGKHFVNSAVAVAAAAASIGVSLLAIKSGLEKVVPESKRGVQYRTAKGTRIIDDTYNANPMAVQAAIDLLRAAPEQQKILVLGDMGELGENAAHYHKAVGEYAKAAALSAFYGYGDMIKHAVHAFGEMGNYFADKQVLAQELKKTLAPNTLILVKGSRSMGMEQVVQALLES